MGITEEIGLDIPDPVVVDEQPVEDVSAETPVEEPVVEAEPVVEPEVEVEPESPPEDETPAEEPDKAKAGLVADLQAERKKRHDAELALARSQGREEAKAKTTTDVQEKSPEDLYAEAHGEDMPITVEVSRAQRAWEANQAKKKAEADQAITRKKTMNESAIATQSKYSAEKVGVDLEFARVLQIGEANLTKGDEYDILHSDNPGELAYERCIERTPDLKKLTAVTPTEKPKVEKKPTKKPDPNAESPDGWSVNTTGVHGDILQLMFEK